MGVRVTPTHACIAYSPLYCIGTVHMCAYSCKHETLLYATYISTYSRIHARTAAKATSKRIRAQSSYILIKCINVCTHHAAAASN